MSLAPRVVLVHRVSEYEELLARHGTHGQAAFVLGSRGDDLDALAARHHATRDALTRIAARIPLTWRQARVERADLDRFLFAPEDIVVVAGQDGLVANVAQYLHDQPVIGIDTDPGRNPGVLVRHRPRDAAALLRAAAGPRVTTEALTMAEGVTDDGRTLLALNEIYVGSAGHRTARYRLRPGAQEGEEAQASSGVLVGTGTGAGGWLRSLWQERGAALPLPKATEDRLLWFVREAWPSPATGVQRVAGLLAERDRLTVTVESDRLVAFADGMESDALELTWGQTLRTGVSQRRLRLVV
ncbi:inorganic polyphosphate kinase [Streptomyces sp. NRRL F-5630]|uniref:inorganic polyphosphate kinase n=1 Tax=Streptomyces sp. NRRL F-5630 TaxID=1463864 RepID=UPI0004CB2434|nr:inorganic polyphosphate kinase [Streptomyces sp. NRRL F-5630]